jgi:GT2 family glycosyltransferase
MTLSRSPADHGPLRRHLAARDPAVSCDVLHGAASMASGYNALAARAPAAASLFVFVHDDARLHFDWRVLERYVAALPDGGVLGFAGCGRLAFDARWWHGHPKVGAFSHGRLALPGLPNRLYKRPSQVVDDGLRCEPVEAVDGYCLVVARDVFERIGRFDERFDGWHCYDVDLCMAALSAGRRNYVLGQQTQHLSRGSTGAGWAQQSAKFLEKWRPWFEAAGRV